jgi:riboflavin kinase/FMN adenylyltransferase
VAEQSVVAVGNFDGVHPGHQAVLKEARRLEPGLPLVVVSFWPHPLQVLHPDAPPLLLTSLDGRIERLKAAGADRVEVIDFTREFAAKTPAEFVRDVIAPLQPARVVVGENFRFGAGAKGDVASLRAAGAALDPPFAVTALPLVKFEDEETCSTRIREALAAGDVRHAAEHLGRPFRFRGIVVHGDHRGRALGFPTANLAVPPGMAIPADGVYAGYLYTGPPATAGKQPAAISVGSNPTFAGAARRIEAHVIGRDDLDLYGELVTVEFTDRIRDMARFAGPAELTAQLAADVAATRRLVGV